MQVRGFGAGKLLSVVQDGLASACELIVSTVQVLVDCDGCLLTVHGSGSRNRILANACVPAGLALRIANAQPADVGHKGAILRAPGVTVTLSGLSVTASQDSDAPAGPGHIIQVVLRENGQEAWILHLVRFGQMAELDAAELRALAQLGPLFASVLQRLGRAEQSALVGAAGWAILDHLLLGVALLDLDGRLRAANHKALALFKSADAIELRNGRIGLGHAGDNERFKGALRELTRSEDIAARAFVADRANNDTGLQLILVRLAPIEEYDPADQPLISLFIADPGFVTVADCLRDLYGLTRVEADVANLICQGLSPGEAAEKLHMSVHTVRGYLKPMFRKMGARRQADILRIVAAGSGLVQIPSEAAKSKTRKPLPGPEALIGPGV